MLKEVFSQLIDVFSPATLSGGREYQQHNYVLNVRFSEGLVKARVKGEAGQIFDVYIDLHTWPQKPGHCSCRYSLNCKHAVACLLELQAREALKKGSPELNSSLMTHLEAFEKERRIHSKEISAAKS